MSLGVRPSVRGRLGQGQGRLRRGDAWPLQEDESPDRWGNRPVWEPNVHRSAVYIEENPSTEADALDCLLRQGCQDPPRHFLRSHQCRVPQCRLECMREINRWERNRHMVEVMATKLPKELVLTILEYVARDTQRQLYLEHRTSLRQTARSIIGDSPVNFKLQPLAEEAILNTSVISSKVIFQGDRGGKVAILPPFVPDLPHPIRHFELSLRIELAFERQQYPGVFYSATAGMASLLSQLPRLQTFHLILVIALSLHPRDHHRAGATTDILNLACRKGFSGTSTFKQTIVDLIDAARAKEPGPKVSLELRYDHPEKWRAPWKSPLERHIVEARERPAVEVVEEADAMHLW